MVLVESKDRPEIPCDNVVRQEIWRKAIRVLMSGGHRSVMHNVRDRKNECSDGLDEARERRSG